MPGRPIWVAAFLTVLVLSDSRAADEKSSVAYDEGILKDAGVGTSGEALLDFFRKRTLSADDDAKLVGLVRRLGDLSFTVREQATTDLIGLGRTARKHLQTALEDPDPEIVRRAERCLRYIEAGPGALVPHAAARLLGVRKPDGAAAAILNFLPFADEEVLEEELVASLAAVANPNPALLAALKDKRVVCRAAAAQVLGRSGSIDVRAGVKPLLADAEPRVRLGAAQGLLEGKDKDAVPALLKLLAGTPLPVAWSAEEILCRVAGEQAPQVSLGAGKDDERRKCRDAWIDWWDKQGGSIDLAKIDLEQRLLGLTLIVTLDGATRGKVWEVGPDGKARWEINDVQGPIDARVLPGNRVLIAEYYGRKVTERDFTGKILWTFDVPNRPISVQRLPSGNTLIGTNSDIQEVTPDGKTVFSHRAVAGGSISSVQKLRNGNVVYVTYNGQLVELDATGKQVRDFRFATTPQGLFSVEALPGGRFLIPLYGANKVVEFDAAGKTVSEVAVTRPNTACRLPNGNLVVSSMNDNKVVEVDRTGKVVWEQKVEGRPFRVRRR
jgi:outer membrane protein assembly factor BamB